MNVLVWMLGAALLVATAAGAAAGSALARGRAAAVRHGRRVEGYVAAVRGFAADVPFAPTTEGMARLAADRLGALGRDLSVQVFLDGATDSRTMRLTAWSGALSDAAPRELTPADADRCAAVRVGTTVIPAGARRNVCACPLALDLAAGRVCVPLTQHGRVAGVLSAGAPAAHPLLPSFAETVEAFGAIASLSLTSLATREATLNDALHDGLTGLFNWRFLDASLSQTLRLTSRLGQPVGLLMVDVDGFKSVNDRWGHAAGDRTLQRLARCMTGNVRDGDLVARYGGDEFVVVMPNAPRMVAMAAAQRILGAVRTAISPESGLTGPSVTLSIGVACAPEDGIEPDVLLAAADRELYRAKQQGRDRVAGRAVAGV